MKKILICGEAWGEHEERKRAPFVGPTGGVLRAVLAQAGIEMDEVHLTNVFNARPPDNDVLHFFTRERSESAQGYPAIQRGRYLQVKHEHHVQRLMAEVKNVNPNVILALGNTALWALCHTTGIGKLRGFPLLTYDNQFKVIPSWHPSAVSRLWKLRPVLYMDVCKARDNSHTSALIRPARKVVIAPTLQDIADFYARYIEPAEFVTCDIETKAGQITEVGFAPSATRAIVIPFWCRRYGNYWSTVAEEREAWWWIAHILETKTVSNQNMAYDIQYLWRTMHIPWLHAGDDPMLMHHALQPELRKSLAFLASIYTMEQSWKFMRKDSETLKKED